MAGSLPEVIKQVAEGGIKNIPNTLPPPNPSNWVSYKDSTNQTALIIGTSDNHRVLAFAVKNGDKPREVRYCLKPMSNVGRPPAVQSLTQAKVMDYALDAPFKYLNNATESGKRKFSAVINWYFLSKRIFWEYDGRLRDFTRHLGEAIRDIDAAKRDGSGRSRHLPRDIDDINTMSPEASPEPEEPRSVYSLRSTDRNGSVNNPENKFITNLSREDNPDLYSLVDHLRAQDAEHLLEQIPLPKKFKWGRPNNTEAQSRKLLVGKLSPGFDEIFAYMVPSRSGSQEIEFRSESVQDRKQIDIRDMGRHNLVTPFSKTYSDNRSPLDEPECTRLSNIVKWYFIAGSVATDCVLKETPDYPEQLRSALQYIADKVTIAAVEALTCGKDGEAQEKSGTPRNDETDVQSTIGEDVRMTSPIRDASELPAPSSSRSATASISRGNATRTTNGSVRQLATPSTSRSREPTRGTSSSFENTPTASSSKRKESARGTKRSADEAELDTITALNSISETVTQMKALEQQSEEAEKQFEEHTAGLNDYEKALEVERTQLDENLKAELAALIAKQEAQRSSQKQKQEADYQTYLATWEKKKHDMLAKQNEIKEKKREAKRRFRRQSMAVAGAEEEDDD